MDKLVMSMIGRYKDHEKDDELTKKVVKRYMTCKHWYIVSLNELLLNIFSGSNASKMNQDIIEDEYKKYREDV